MIYKHFTGNGAGFLAGGSGAGGDWGAIPPVDVGNGQTTLGGGGGGSIDLTRKVTTLFYPAKLGASYPAYKKTISILPAKETLKIYQKGKVPTIAEKTAAIRTTLRSMRIDGKQLLIAKWGMV